MCSPYLGHVGEPLQESVDPLKVVAHCAVCHSVVVHDLNASQLIVRCVDLPTQDLQVTGHTPPLPAITYWRQAGRPAGRALRIAGLFVSQTGDISQSALKQDLQWGKARSHFHRFHKAQLKTYLQRIPAIVF